MSGESFGVGPLPGTMTTGRHGSNKDDGMMLGEKERSNPPSIKMGSKTMDATAHSDHGDHMHSYAKM